jgi:hypothetical protein
MTPREFARAFRIGCDRVRGMILRGELGAINVAPARCGRPRFVILPDHVRAFVNAHQAVTPERPSPRRRRTATEVDYFPD